MRGSSAASPARPSPERAPLDHGNATIGSAAGLFEHFPGPVLVVAPNGVVLSANDLAGPLVRLLRGRGSAELLEAIRAALAGRVAQINPLLFEADGPGAVGQAVDLVALPWADGTAVLLLGRDITLERSLRSALIESRQRYKDLVEASGDFAWETDSEGRFCFVSSGALGFAVTELVGQPARDFVIDGGDQPDGPFATRTALNHVPFWFRDARGGAACLTAVAVPLLGPDGGWRGARGICRDVTEARDREAALARARHREGLLAYILRLVRDEQEPRRLIEAAAAALLPALPATGAAVYLRARDGAPAPVAQVGRLPEPAVFAPLLQRVRDGQAAASQTDDRGRLLVRATACKGARNGALVLWHEAAERAWGQEEEVLLDEVTAQIGVASHQLEREAELETLAATDPLTGLLNRRKFLEHLGSCLDQSERRRRPAALFYLDLDDFKLLNDSRGHQAGDRALAALADVLRGAVRSDDLAARLGGDEFGLFCLDMSADSAVKKGQELIRATRDLAEFDADSRRRLGVSVGIAVYEPQRPEDGGSLIARADAAMYAAKRRGKGGVFLAPHGGPAA